MIIISVTFKVCPNKIKNGSSDFRKVHVHFSLHISSSSSCRAASTDLPDPFLPPVFVVYCFREVLLATSCIGTELLNIGSCWSSNLCSSMWRVHWSTSLMSSSLLLQQCPACLVRILWIVFVMGGRWPYSCCFVGCCHQDLFNMACSILV